MNLLFKLLKVRWVFTKPQKKEVLIYDNMSKIGAKFLFNESDCEILYIRYEQINLNVLFKTLITNGFKNIKDNYKINYLKSVSPKIIFSIFTYNPAFFRLKSLYPLSTYICLSMSSCDERFFRLCENYYKNNLTPKLKSDYLFVVGDYYKEKMSHYIETKIINIGSIKNNFYFLDKKKEQLAKKSDVILFISQVYALKEKEISPSYRDKIENEKKILLSLEKYCIKKNFKLKVATRNNKEGMSFYKKNFGEGNWTIYPRLDESTSYNLVNESFFIIFTNSFLGLEALSKGKKCVAFPPEEFPIQRFGKTFSNQGPFWSSTFNEEILKNYIDKILSYDEDSWRKIVDQNVGDLVKYNPGNSILKKTLHDLRIKNILN